MKKILNWFKKRTLNKVLMVLFAAEAIILVIFGKWWVAFVPLGFFLSWILIDIKQRAIEAQDNTINLLMRDNKQLKGKLDLENAKLMRVFALYFKYKAIADLCQRKIDLATYIKRRQEADVALEGADIVINVVQHPDFQESDNQTKPQGE